MSYHPRIKICGITNESDAQQAAALGADAIGLNFYPPSPRCVAADAIGGILRNLPLFIEAVGVFVNEPLPEVLNRLQEFGRIRGLQWHGEDREVRNVYPYHLISAFSVRDVSSLVAIHQYLDVCRTAGAFPSAVLVDAYAAGLHGGTGQTAPWDLLAEFRPGVPMILAGGLTPENVAAAVRRVRPWGVDVASGVEASPGRKDHEQMRRFIDAVREAAAGIV